MPLDEPALVRAHVRQVGGIERPQLQKLVGERLAAADDAIGEDELDPLPAVTGHDLEERPNLDLQPRLLADLARERVLHPLTLLEKTAEESPLRGAEAVPRQEHATLGIDANPDDADEEAVVRGGEESPLPADGERVEDDRERAHEHRETLGECGLMGDCQRWSFGCSGHSRSSWMV